MKIKTLILSLALSLMCFQANAAPIVFFDFDGDALQDTSASVTLGSTFTASLYVSNVDLTEGGLLGWGTEINFNSTMLTASSFTIDNAWFVQSNSNNIDNATGSIELNASRFSGLTGSIKLADITFDTLTAGSSMLTMNELFPDLVSFIGFGGANTPSYNYDADIIFANANATINVTSVPLPASLILFISGLMGLTGVGKIRFYRV